VAYTDASREALHLLRDPGQFKWYVVTLLGLCIYVYTVEVERRRWDIVLAGLAFWGMDWFNEMANSVILHASGRSALWTVTGDTAYLIFVGLTIEISLLFLISGVTFAKALPRDRHLRILGVPNRWLMVLGYALFCTGVEVLLHATGYFHWHYWWWNVPFVPLIVVFGYGTFFAVAAWVYDMGTDHRRQVRVVATIAAVDVVFGVVFGAIGWL
jgi:hypothetical protein